MCPRPSTELGTSEMLKECLWPGVDPLYRSENLPPGAPRKHSKRGPIARPHSKYSLWLQEGQVGLDFHKAQEDPEREGKQRGEEQCTSYSGTGRSFHWLGLEEDPLGAWPCTNHFMHYLIFIH